jgi:predicted restriction endonuclease
MRYVRSLAVKERVLAERGARCQVCGFTFRTKDGTDYAEAHHIRPVSAGGPDHADNILVLCPNHHRQLHRAEVTWPHGQSRPRGVVISGEAVRVRWQF